jgi:hypothetical protein
MSARGRGPGGGDNYEYVPVGGWPGYFVDREGHVFSSKSWRGRVWRELAYGRDDDGYVTIQVTEARRTVKLRVHRIVANAFCFCDVDDCEVRHLDGNKDNNAASNLRWGTQRENAADRERHGRTIRGSRHPNAKLTEDAVSEIKALLRASETHRSIAAQYGVSKGTVGHIAIGLKWRHVA